MHQKPCFGTMRKPLVKYLAIAAGVIVAFTVFQKVGIFVAGVAVLLMIASVMPDPVPGNVTCPYGYSYPIYFCSEDMSPIEITRQRSRTENDAPIVQIAVPRAYIYFVPRYETRQYRRLPDRIATESINVSFTYPDGTPLTIFEPRLNRQRRMQETGDAAQPPQGRFGEEVRMHTLVAEIYLVNEPAQVFGERIRASRTRSLERAHQHEGREYFSGHRQHVYLGQRGVDEFDFISCWENSYPLHYCEAQIQVSNRIVASVRFVDFRFHGGFDFANERLRVARRTICNFAVPSCSIDRAMN